MPYSIPLTWRKTPLTVRPQTQQLAGWAARGGPRGGTPVPGFVTGAPTERKPPAVGAPSLVWGAETGRTPPTAPPPDWKPWTKEKLKEEPKTKVVIEHVKQKNGIIFRATPPPPLPSPSSGWFAFKCVKAVFLPNILPLWSEQILERLRLKALLRKQKISLYNFLTSTNKTWTLLFRDWRTSNCHFKWQLKRLSHEIDFKKFDQTVKNLT